MAAQDAELQLKVSLDLAFFRQQLAGLGQAAAGTPLQVRIQFDRRSVQNELNTLGANIRRRNYRLNVETNLSAEIAKADTLARKLGELSSKIKPAAVSGASSGRQAIADIEQVLKGGLSGKAFGIQQAQENIARQAILSRLEKKSLTAGGYNKAGLEKIIKDLGGTPTSGRADLVAQAKKLVEEANDITDAVFNNLKDLQMKLRPIRGQAQTSAARSMPNLNEMLDRMANLTSNPRAAQRMLRMMPENRITTDLVGTANRQAAFQEQFPQGFTLPDFNAPKAFDPLLKAIAKDFSDYARTVNISDPWVGQIGNGIANVVAKAATAAAPQAQKLLPAAGQTSATRFNPNVTRPIFAAAQTAQAGGGQPFSFTHRMGSIGQFPMAGMMGPFSPLSINARTSMFGGSGMQPPSGGGGGFGGMSGAGGFGRALGSIGNLPGSGTINELGGEFAFATKQVLLFGQAYKLLGFAQDFPAQVGAAVSQLQSFRNTLLSVTGSAGAAADANEFILAAVEKYSIPLQSARDGFTKLFASMEPAGFAAGEIQNLFLGISKAAATYGLSADKVDRVNYAFAQMASKGQVMSEELKGQLGDVLPGAMGIFAEAAGFKGPDAIQKFGKALEDGVYKGGKMRELLRNVADGMNKEFGPGAEGAAKTFQGAMNRMQTATAKLYESFEPAAIGIMNAVMVPFVQTLKNVTDGVNAYFSGQTAATPAAQDFTNILKTLVPTLTGIGENLKYVFQQVSILVQGFGALALQIGRLLALPIVRYLAGTYVQVLLLTTAFRALVTSGIGAALVAIARFIAQGVVYAQVTLGMRVATQQTTVAMYQFGTAVQTVMIKSVIGIALVAISAFIARIVELRGQLAAISGDAKSMEDLAKSSAKLGDVEGAREAVGNIRDRVEAYKQLKEQIQSAQKTGGRTGEGATAGMTQEVKLTTALGNKMVELGLISKRTLQASSNGYKVNELALDGVLVKINENINSFSKAGQKSQQYIDQAIKQSKKLKEQGGLGLDGPDEAAAEKARREAEKLANQQQQLAIDAANRQNALDNARFDHLLKMSDAEFEHWKSLQDAKYDYELAGLNSIEARQFKFQKDLQQIEINRIEAVRKAEQAVAQAQQEVVTTQRTAAASGGVTGLLQGSTGISSGPHFDVRRADGSAISETEARALFSEEVRGQLTMTSPYGPRVAPVPGASTFHRGVDLAGPANTPLNLAPGYSLQGVAQEGGLGYAASVSGPQGRMYKVGHVQAPGASYTRQRRSEKADGKGDVAQLQASLRNTEMLTIAQDGYTLALAKTDALIKQNIATIFPVAELQLETSLLKMRNQLQMQGMPAEYIQYMEESFKAEYEANEAKKAHNATIDEYGKKINDLQDKQAKGVKLTTEETAYLKYAEEQIKKNKDALATLTEQQKAYQIAQLESAVATMKNADALKALEETSGRINQAVEGVTGTYKDMFKEIAKGGDSVEALKKAQDALADQALTMFFDFAMQPVEKFFKDQLGAIFGVPNEEEQRKATIQKMEEQLAKLREIEAATKQTAANTGAPSPGVPAPDGKQQSMNYASTTSAYGGAFVTPFSESTSSLTESANAYSEQLGKVDDSVWGSAMTLGQASEEMGPNGAAGKTWQQSLGSIVGGLGMAAGSIMGIMGGINQIKEGGTSNVLGGIGMIASMAGSLIGGFGGMFGGGSAGQFGTSTSFNGTADALGKAPFAPKLGPVFANGGIASGGFRAFANGGLVNGPTLGLVGEGKYNEAIVPLPDGKSIPVQLGGRSARDLMGGNAPGMPAQMALNMKFESTKINGVEYVSREQLEQAMAETRRASIAGGAQRGMSMTLDKIQQSPSTRSRIGVR